MRYSNTRYISLFLCFGFGLFIATTAHAQSVVYVNHAATGANDGTSWANAYTFLQNALQAAQSGDEVWVAQGVYRPDQGAGVVPEDRRASFAVPTGVSVFGGFDGTESGLEERNWTMNETRLDGDLLGNDDDVIALDNPLRFDNSHHVVQIFDLSMSIVIDGFTISGGMAEPFPEYYGSAIEIDSFPLSLPEQPTRIKHCLFTNNVAVSGTVSVASFARIGNPVVVVSNSVFENNYAGTGAGMRIVLVTTHLKEISVRDNHAEQGTAIHIEGAEVYVENTIIARNTASSLGIIDHASTEQSTLFIWNSAVINNHVLNWGSGGISADNARIVSINNIFSGNSTQAEGGAIRVGAGGALIVNNVFAFNSAATSGGAISTVVSNTNISNSIFWENTAPLGPEIHSQGIDTVSISHSFLQYPLPSFVIDNGGIITGDPLFQDADGIDNIQGTIDDDFQLLYWSPAVDAGANDSLFTDFWDLDNDGDFDEFWPTDFYGDPRVIGIRPSSFPVVDLGPFEFNGPPPTAIEEDESPGANGPSIIGVYPNPFASNTSITITVDHPSEIRIEVYNILGKRVRVLEQGFRAAGEHRVQLDATEFSAGVYFVRLSAAAVKRTQKLIVVK